MCGALNRRETFASVVELVPAALWKEGSQMTEPSKELERVERERDLWRARFERLMGWVKWFRDDVCNFDKRASLRLAKGWQGLNRSVGQEDLFMASLEIEAEAQGRALAVTHLAASKDEQFRACALKLAEGATEAGKPQGERGQES